MLKYMLINNFNIEVNRKQVKNINLKVYHDLTIKASVPENMNIDIAKRMIMSKEDWINKQLKKYEEQNRITKICFRGKPLFKWKKIYIKGI